MEEIEFDLYIMRTLLLDLSINQVEDLDLYITPHEC